MKDDNDCKEFFSTPEGKEISDKIFNIVFEAFAKEGKNFFDVDLDTLQVEHNEENPLEFIIHYELLENVNE